MGVVAGSSIVHMFLSELQTEAVEETAHADDDEKPDPRMLSGAELWEMYRIIDPTVRVCLCVCVCGERERSVEQHCMAARSHKREARGRE